MTYQNETNNLIFKTMKTLIVKENGNEEIKGNLVFRVLMNRTRLDGFRNETYSKAITRLEILKSIFKYSRFEIVVEINN